MSQNTKSRATLRAHVSPRRLAEIKIFAAQEGVTLNELLRQALELRMREKANG